MNITIIAGSFNDAGGKSSGWAQKLCVALSDQLGGGSISFCHNGGSLEDLDHCFSALPETGVVLWLADVPNDKPKLIKQIKEKQPKLFLVSSKRNLDGKYPLQDLVSRALDVKANLLLEITGNRSGLETSIIDPLGNVFLLKEPDINSVARVLVRRLETLTSVSRIGSKQIGEAIAVPSSDPEILGFLDIVKSQAEVFHNIIHGVNTTRMLGNASFRCERGFPSFKNGGMIFVSQRNVDKRFIGPEAFVAVKNGIEGVEYYGTNKPSVDTPVQLELYTGFPKIRFMLHSHTYILGAPFTKDVLPCGALEEADQIQDACPYGEDANFSVNIKGHGSICLASNLAFIRSVKWIARPSPEIVSL